MKQRVSLKLLVLFGIICTTFFVAESKLHAATVANKSSTFSTQLNNRDDDSGNDSELAEKIRAQRAAIEARENRDAAATQTKTSAKQNNCDNDLRKCISAQCGANYKRCETDSDITFSDKLTGCRKETTCTAHEFTLFTNEIKEDKKQAIDLAMYNTVIDCGNSYNDCIIQQCGPKFNKCLSKSNGDNAIAACKQIAQNCTEADSGLVGRVGNVFGIVRQDAEKQIKADEQKLQKLRDSMRNSCRTLGAMFDDRTLDCVFNVSFYAGDDQKTPKASRKLYAGSLFDCTPDWFSIDVTTFKENAYRLTRSQTAASSAMLGAGVGTAVGAITSGAIGRAIDTKKAKDALKEECEKAGQKLKDGKCVDMTQEEQCKANGGKWKNNTCVDTPAKEAETPDEQTPGAEKTPQQDQSENEPETPTNTNGKPCTGEQIGAAAGNLIGSDRTEQRDGVCVPVSCKTGYTLDGNQCVEAEEEEEQLCTPTELQTLNAKAGLKDAKGVCIPSLCLNGRKPTNGACNPATIEKMPALTTADVPPTLPTIDKNAVARDTCTDSGGDWNDKKNTCSCSKKKGLKDGNIKGFSCQCQMNGYEYDKQSNKCIKKSSNTASTPTTTTQTNNSAKDKCEQSGGKFYAINNRCECPDEKLLEQTSDRTACQCATDYQNKNLAYFDKTAKRCYFTDEALAKCGTISLFDTSGKPMDVKATGDKEHGCVCPEPYEKWQSPRPMLTCLKPA